MSRLLAAPQLRPLKFNFFPLNLLLTLIALIALLILELAPSPGVRIDLPSLSADDVQFNSPLSLYVDSELLLYYGPEKRMIANERLLEELQLERAMWAKRFPESEPQLFLHIDRGLLYGDFLSLLRRVQPLFSQIRLVYSSGEVEG